MHQILIKIQDIVEIIQKLENNLNIPSSIMVNNQVNFICRGLKMENDKKELSDKVGQYLLGDDKALKELNKQGGAKDYLAGEIAALGGAALFSRNPLGKVASILLSADLLIRAGNYLFSYLDDKNAKIEEQPGLIGSIKNYMNY